MMDAQLVAAYQEEIGSQFTDSLTGLLNHGFFEMSLVQEFKRCERYAEPFTLALLDIDGFKHYNKRRSALAGDRLLREIAEVVKHNIRQVDLAARYEGDVLAVVFIKSGTETALAPLERIRQAVEEKYGRDPTVSIGLASYPADAHTKEALIEKAQQALVAAKASGRNKVRYFEQLDPVHAGAVAKILVVDDDPRNVKLMEALLLQENYQILKAYSGEEALAMVNKTDVDLIMLDVMMPEMNGYEVCRRLKGSEATRLIPVVMVTALNEIEDKIKGIEAGADDFLTKPPNQLELLARTKSLVKLKKLNNSFANIERVLFSLANTVEAKDAYTQGHVERVSSMAMALGQKMALSAEELEALHYGGVLHDIGKIGVPSSIINKPGPLDEDEWRLIQTHPDIGYRICLPIRKNLGAALDVIRYHHEKLDGSGYPDGLKGAEIAPVARVMAVVDIYDALITERPYRKALAREKAIGILYQEAREGKLDLEVVANFESIVSVNQANSRKP